MPRRRARPNAPKRAPGAIIVVAIVVVAIVIVIIAILIGPVVELPVLIALTKTMLRLRDRWTWPDSTATVHTNETECRVIDPTTPPV